MSAAGNQTKATSIPAIERASERSWADWLTLFEAEGAAKLPHSEIAKIALAALPESLQNPHWWAQGVAIAFEQHTGLRVPGQSSTGDFRVSASRTMTCNRDEAIERWIARFAGSTHLGHEAQSVRQSRTEKRSFWRATLDGAGKLEVAAEAKPDGRALVSISQSGLASPDTIEAWRAHWKACLGEL